MQRLSVRQLYRGEHLSTIGLLPNFPVSLLAHFSPYRPRAAITKTHKTHILQSNENRQSSRYRRIQNNGNGSEA